MTVEEKYHFDYRKVEKALRKRIDCMAEMASHDCGRKFYAVGSFYRRVLFCLVNGEILLPLLSDRRPPERKVIAFGEAGSAFFDLSADSEEYLALASLLKVSTEEEAVIYHQSTQFDFAVVEKRSMPARIATDEDAQVHGVFLDALERNLLQQGFSLWWQEWGGVLSKCQFGVGTQMLVSSFEAVRFGIGKCKRLPSFLVR